MATELNLSAFQETPEEREERKRKALRKRIILLASTLAVAIVARLIIKDPPPPRVADYSKDQIRYVPGMLDNMPASERARLDPKIVAKMVEVDENAKKPKTDLNSPLFASGPYKPAEPIIDSDLEGLKYKQQLAFTVQKRRLQQQKIEEQVDITKPMLVRLQNGRYLKAEKSIPIHNNWEIRLDRTILAQIPKHLVSSVTSDALTWEEPVEKGLVRLKPAKGITITVDQETAKRITVRKNLSNET